MIIVIMFEFVPKKYIENKTITPFKNKMLLPKHF